jgi:hypothetical protein
MLCGSTISGADGNEAVHSVEAGDGAQRLRRADELERLAARAGLAQPGEEQREQRRIHLAHFAEVDGAHAFLDLASPFVEQLRDVAERHRARQQHALAVAADHGLPPASSERFLVARSWISPSTPEVRTALANSVR